MNFLSNIGSFFSEIFHSVECYFQPEAPTCAAPSREATDHFEPIPPLDQSRLDLLIRESQPVRIGCYMEMHVVREISPQRLQEAVRQRPPARPPQH